MGAEYPHIDTVYKRHMEGPDKGRIIEGEFTRPEFAYLARCEWIGTEKVDGTNVRVSWDVVDADHGWTGRYTGVRPPVCSDGKTNNAQIPSYLVARLRELFDDIDIDAMLPKAGDAPITLYGEGYGAKIQKGGGNYKADGCDFALFDVKVGEWWLERQGIEEVAAALKLDIVPIVWKGTLTSACEFVRGGFESRWGPFRAEGLVLKPAVELRTRGGVRIITKIKERDFR